MATADSSEVPIYIPILAATLPVILSPVVAWFLGRSRISEEAATIDYLNKRLDILERLNRLHTQLTEGPIKVFLETGDRTLPDVSASAADVHSTRCRGGGGCASITLGSLLSRPTRRVRAQAHFQRALLSFGIAMLALPLLAITSLSDQFRDNPLEFVAVYASFFGFYFVLALLFRLWAR